MSRRTRMVLGLLLVAALLGLAGGGAWWWYQRQLAEPVVREVPRRGGTDVTLLALSDLHFGATILDADKRGRQRWITALPVRRTINDQMQHIAGKPYPEAIGGRVNQPSSLIITGDLTEDGKPEEWQQFAEFFALQPTEPEPSADSRPPAAGERWPVYECPGNHDKHTGFYVSQQVAARHGGDFYSINYGDLHVVSLRDGPDDDGLRWLKRDLAATGRERPVILFMHYPLVGPFSDSWWGSQPDLTKQFARIIRGFNVIAILHGHWHVPGHYRWHGIDVYNIGSIKHGARCFGVIHVTDNRYTFASWNAQQNNWWWWHSKPINSNPTTDGIFASHLDKGLLSTPAIPYPVGR